MSQLNELPKRPTNPKRDAALEYVLIGFAVVLTCAWMMS